MKKLFLVGSLLFFAHSALADTNLEPLLNKVTLQLQAQQWVTTKTALVNVDINAAVTDQGIEQVQAQAMQKLSELSRAGEWHIISFDRQQDKSGLENIQIVAQARLPQDALADLRTKAKAISKPGETLTIDTVQFVPSDDEVREANIFLRNTIYQQTKMEIDSLNKIYPDQKYYLHQIDFVSPPILPVAQNMMLLAKSAPAKPLSIGNKVELQAMVVLAAMPDVVTQKLTH